MRKKRSFLLWEQGVEGSNPFAPTWKSRSYKRLWPLFFAHFKKQDTKRTRFFETSPIVFLYFFVNPLPKRTRFLQKNKKKPPPKGRLSRKYKLLMSTERCKNTTFLIPTTISIAGCVLLLLLLFSPSWSLPVWQRLRGKSFPTGDGLLPQPLADRQPFRIPYIDRTERQRPSEKTQTHY